MWGRPLRLTLFEPLTLNANQLTIDFITEAVGRWKFAPAINQFAILECLSILDLALSRVKGTTLNSFISHYPHSNLVRLVFTH